ncbi:MAG: hypothetical protein E6Q34_09125 [Burkholderiaceae bacterium]|nr:MAG: hypothetical protein E6Q34_09125 [Burkholderiaceae bacterium]
MYKMLTTVAVLQLVEQQRIDLDAPLIRYLPSYPNHSLAEQVSIFLKQADQLRPSVERQDASQEDQAMALQVNSCIDLRLDFERAMQNLNATEQLVLLHCVQLDLTHEEVAQVLGLPLGTVKSNATRGKSKLQAWRSAWMQTSKKSSDQGSTS